MELANQVAVITGGASGIGAATAALMAAHGARLVLLDRDEHGLHAQASALRANGTEVLTRTVDVADRSSIENAIEAALTTFGRLDIMVSNAGITQPSRTLKVSNELWERVVDVNLSGVFWSCQAALRPMLAAGYGRLLLTSSTSSLGSLANVSYASTKAALVAMVRSLAMEFGKSGITVNAVAPGLIETPLTADVAPEIKERWIRQTPIGRLGRAEEIARVFLFLASPAAGYITGQTIFVDGGFTLPKTMF